MKNETLVKNSVENKQQTTVFSEHLEDIENDDRNVINLNLSFIKKEEEI